MPETIKKHDFIVTKIDKDIWQQKNIYKNRFINISVPMDARCYTFNYF